ncbi:efflux RND transporter periplasmic adaptor subunit [Mesorhizobium sp. M4B.F.Ca.ET.049.02.1.2]|uniref:HlyD family secretion protein n=1 Tax=Mesorhizobium sp. M4B.F.Ca.ET.049.02.1.2 TaxID=2496752 RepID=UPI000FCA8377|nr:efflux RND transporter periplasmic adaptor subunit [Mesorhizobium sp. M4B.F.Ca.ET.049.02.1.2]RUW76601.1 HlyD family efflux transporter periplasmic adaptor subunit [Mesorhizobium sp. M4B.F.Ca.ET.049.02.1.2]
MKKSWLWSLVTLVILAAGSYALYAYLQPSALAVGLVYGNGRVEATEVRIGSEIAGRVAESRLIEGMPVSAGDLLVRIDDTELSLRLAQSKAERETVARALVKAKAELEVAHHHAGTAKADVDRYRSLAANDTVSQQRLEQAENAYREAAGQATALEAAVGEAEAQLTASDKGVAVLEDQVGRTRIAAPVVGTILVKATEPGEVVAPGQTLAVMADLSRLELKLFVPERDLAKIKLGAPARVISDAFPDRFATAAVTRVDESAQFTPRDIHMPDERVQTVFGITLAVDNPRGQLKPGMPADAWIKWDEAAIWPDRLAVPR